VPFSEPNLVDFRSHYYQPPPLPIKSIMGVFGWSRLLAEEGWIPLIGRSSQPDPTSLWLDQDTLDRSHALLEDRLVEIPPGSELHIDGYCLCFRIHEVAYARHCQQVLKKKKVPAHKWKAHQIRHMIPSFLPPALLTQVTQEFVTKLRDSSRLQLLVYWDGDERYAPPTGSASHPTTKTEEVSDSSEEEEDYDTAAESDDDKAYDNPMMEEDLAPAAFKHETELERQAKRTEEWSVFQDYCIHGKVPTDIELQQWQRYFPKNRIFITQVMQALLKMQVPMKFCNEEADSIMARAVMGKKRAYILGLDSDFCFFPNASYIPINTLIPEKKMSSIKAIVMRRDILADSLDIPESAMVELAILMGNDYVKGTKTFDLPKVQGGKKADLDDREAVLPTNENLQHRNMAIRIQAFLSLLRQQGEGYRIQSRSTEIQKCLDFIRKLYNLHDMSCYKMEQPVLGMEPSLPTAAIGMTEELSAEFKNAIIDPTKGDKSLQDAVVRYLVMILKHVEERNQVLVVDGTPQPKVLTPSHIQAFQLLSRQRPPYSEIDQQIKDPSWRPFWSDAAAVYWIERLINSIVHNVIEQQHIEGKPMPHGIESPGELFDPYLYHSYLRVAREMHGVLDEKKEDADVPELSPEGSADSQDVPPKLKLPVDEFEQEILKSVRQNRVTIIQGDTGCGMYYYQGYLLRKAVLYFSNISPHPT
jgi:XPG domain containing